MAQYIHGSGGSSGKAIEYSDGTKHSILTVESEEHIPWGSKELMYVIMASHQNGKRFIVVPGIIEPENWRRKVKDTVLPVTEVQVINDLDLQERIRIAFQEPHRFGKDMAVYFWNE